MFFTLQQLRSRYLCENLLFTKLAHIFPSTSKYKYKYKFTSFLVQVSFVRLPPYKELNFPAGIFWSGTPRSHTSRSWNEAWLAASPARAK